MKAHIFHLRLRNGVVVRGIRVLAEGREQAAARVFRMYPRSTECVEAGAAAGHANDAGALAFSAEIKRSAQSTRHGYFFWQPILSGNLLGIS